MKTALKIKFEEFVKQIKNINIKYIHILLFDIAFIVLFLIGFTLWNKILSSQTKAASLQDIQQMAVNAASVQNVKELTFLVVILSIILVLYIIAASSVTRGYIWSIIFNKKPNKEFLKKFTLLNLVYILPYLILILLSIGILQIITNSFISSFSRLGTNTVVSSIIALMFGILFIGPFFLYFFNLSGMINIYFMKSNKIFSSIINPFKFILNKGFVLYVPYVLITALFFILSAVLLIFNAWPMLYNYAAVVLILAYTTFIRFYLKELID